MNAHTLAPNQHAIMLIAHYFILNLLNGFVKQMSFMRGASFVVATRDDQITRFQLDNTYQLVLVGI